MRNCKVMRRTGKAMLATLLANALRCSPLRIHVESVRLFDSNHWYMGFIRDLPPSSKISKKTGRHSGKTHGDFKTKSRLGRVKRVVVIEGDMNFFACLGEIANTRRYASYLVI